MNLQIFLDIIEKINYLTYYEETDYDDHCGYTTDITIKIREICIELSEIHNYGDVDYCKFYLQGELVCKCSYIDEIGSDVYKNKIQIILIKESKQNYIDFPIYKNILNVVRKL